MGIDFMGPFPSSRGEQVMSRGQSDYLSKWVEAKGSPPMMPEKYGSNLHSSLHRLSPTNKWASGSIKSWLEKNP
ncbi:hypothetical protein Tco_0828252 [Tanacetum coccineum]